MRSGETLNFTRNFEFKFPSNTNLSCPGPYKKVIWDQKISGSSSICTALERVFVNLRHSGADTNFASDYTLRTARMRFGEASSKRLSPFTNVHPECTKHTLAANKVTSENTKKISTSVCVLTRFACKCNKRTRLTKKMELEPEDTHKQQRE